MNQYPLLTVTLNII